MRKLSTLFLALYLVFAPFSVLPVHAATDIINDATLGSNLVSCYELDETSGVRYDAVASNDLTDNNTVLYDTGLIGNSADFVKANSESLTNSSLYQTGSFSISLWFRNNSEITTGIYGLMAMSDNTSVLRNILLTYNYNGGSPIVVADYHKNNTTDNNVVWSSGYLGTSAWTHLVVTYDGTTFTFYGNGSSRGTPLTISGGGSGSVGNQGFNLGYVARYASYASVDIDEVGVWSTALSAASVSALYNSGTGIPCDAGVVSSPVFHPHEF